MLKKTQRQIRICTHCRFVVLWSTRQQMQMHNSLLLDCEIQLLAKADKGYNDSWNSEILNEK